MPSPLANLQILSNGGSSRNNPDSYGYDPTEKRFEAVRIERKVIAALRLCDSETIHILQAYYCPLPRIQIDEFVQHFKDYTSLIIYLHKKNLGTIESLKKLIHQANYSKKNEKTTIAAIKQIDWLKSNARKELEKAMHEYSKAYSKSTNKSE